MTALTKPRMTVDEYLNWSVDFPGCHELFRGEVHAIAPESAGHAETKGSVYSALLAAVGRRRLPFHVLPDGLTVRIDGETAYEPDARIYCGEKLAATALEVPNPVIIVEVLSPSTRRVGVSLKLAGYFRPPSVAHYLIVDPTQPLIVHHARGSGDTILTRVITTGKITLDPPGIELALAEIYGT